MLRHFITALSLFIIASLAQAGEAAHIVFVAGQVQVAGKQLELGSAIQEGDEVSTGADGYVYLKTIDNGFLILRPNSRARIVAYHIDTQKPANTRVKLELSSGVARAISGEGVKQAKEHFRFNTPVAAIGVRGTDFTVYTDQETSRVAVISGGVVVSGFTGTCGPEGIGPCEGMTSRELFARQAGVLLQVSKGQAAPQLLPASGISPDTTAPPRGDEPGAKSSSGAGGSSVAASNINLDPQKNVELSQLTSITKLPSTPTPPVVVESPRQISWGRWQAVLDQPANINLAKLLEAKAQLIDINAQFALLRARGSEWEVPHTGTLAFGLRESAAIIHDEARGSLTSATLENARLQVDFGKAAFSTSFDLVNQSERFKMQAQGGITRDGLLVGDSQFVSPTNMAVSGVLTAEKGGTAAYLFQSRLDANRVATGGTYWTK